MNCNKNARIQFALHLLIIDHMSYTCTLFQWFAGLNWTTYSQAFYLGESQVRFVVPRRPFTPRRLQQKAFQNSEKNKTKLSNNILLKRSVQCVLKRTSQIIFARNDYRIIFIEIFKYAELPNMKRTYASFYSFVQIARTEPSQTGIDPAQQAESGYLCTNE